MNRNMAVAAANEATCLSQWLKQPGLYEQNNIFSWLTEQHIDKFRMAINAEEAKNLEEFGRDTQKEDSSSNSRGDSLLDRLHQLSNRRLVSLIIQDLAFYRPRWIATWFFRKNAESFKQYHGNFNDRIIATLDATNLEFKSHLSAMAKLQIIKSRPEFLAFISDEELHNNMQDILEHRCSPINMIDELQNADVLPKGAPLIHAIMGSDQGYAALVQIELFSRDWNSREKSERNPVITVFLEGEVVELNTIFHSPWESCTNPAPGNDLWHDDFYHRPLQNITGEVISFKPASFELELGFSCGTRIASEGGKVTPVTIRAALDKFCGAASGEVVITILPMTKLWALLAKLAEYERKAWQRKIELSGLHAELNQFTSANPVLWARALPWLLPRMAELGQTVEAITYQLASSNSAVWAMLVKLSQHDEEGIRLKARGLQSFLHNNNDANADFPRALADAAARYLDGTPMFPHPLTPLSGTWLGARDIETVIADSIRRACGHFAQEVRDQGGDIEEALTKALIKELELAFRDSQPRIQLFGKHPPILTIKQRPASKSKEEPIYGCDLAWLITGNVKGRFESVWVDLVQVKKSLALQQSKRNLSPATARADSWTIDSKQLDTILHWSQTATYWMIAAAGEVLVIPAKHLAAIRRGTRKLLPQKTFTVGYHEVRSAAIPLAQYLTELLISQWLGTTSDTVIEFAQGENTNCRPRMVIELHVTGRHQEE